MRQDGDFFSEQFKNSLRDAPLPVFVPSQREGEDFMGAQALGRVYFWWIVICVVGLTYFLWDL
jgi:hypothetical protein